MSFVKWWLTQQALPRSAILTDMISMGVELPGVLGVALFLSKEMPDMSLVMISLRKR